MVSNLDVAYAMVESYLLTVADTESRKEIMGFIDSLIKKIDTLGMQLDISLEKQLDLRMELDMATEQVIELTNIIAGQL